MSIRRPQRSPRDRATKRHRLEPLAAKPTPDLGCSLLRYEACLDATAGVPHLDRVLVKAIFRIGLQEERRARSEGGFLDIRDSMRRARHFQDFDAVRREERIIPRELTIILVPKPVPVAVEFLATALALGVPLALLESEAQRRTRCVPRSSAEVIHEAHRRRAYSCLEDSPRGARGDNSAVNQSRRDQPRSESRGRGHFRADFQPFVSADLA
jgi:hypothetical protein